MVIKYFLNSVVYFFNQGMSTIDLSIIQKLLIKFQPYYLKLKKISKAVV